MDLTESTEEKITSPVMSPTASKLKVGEGGEDVGEGGEDVGEREKR